MKQSVKRLTLTGDWTAFEFDYKCRSYFVKNYTEDDIYVSFEANDTEDESFKIKSGIGEEVAISYNRRLNVTGEHGHYDVDTIYVKGTGEVEVEQLDF